MKYPGETDQSAPELVLTANRRLSRRLRWDADRRRIQTGETAWRSFEALPVDAWLRSVWTSLWSDCVPLTPFQEELLWARIIGRSPIRGAVLGHWETARHAAQAHRLLGDWQLPLPEQLPGLEARSFARWRQQFLDTLGENHWVDREAVLDQAIDALADRRAGIPDAVTIAGFDDHTPRLERLLSVLAEGGSRVSVEQVPQLQGSGSWSEPGLTRPKSPDHELALAARWCRETLEREPGARIGVVLPDLHDRAARVREVFDAELTPERVAAGDSGRHGRRYNTSYAPPLAEQPVVALAVRVIKLWGKDPTVPFLTTLLRSPFVAGSVTERNARDRLEESLRSARRYSYDMHDFAQRCGGADRWPHCPRLKKGLDGWCAIATGDASASEWSHRFRALLLALGWPGERKLNSTEQQAVDRLLEALEEFAALDLVSAAMSLATATQLFARLTGTIQFQPQSAETSVEVLGVLECAGMVFDHLWIGGLHEEGWPMRSAPNPLLPVSWQAEHGLPHASAEQEIDYATVLTQRLLGAAPSVIVSAPSTIDDRELLVSPLLPDFTVVEVDPPSAAPTHVLGRLRPSSLLADFRDEKGPPVEGDVQSGGVRLFADQAACAFRGFGRHRLRARALDQIDDTIHPFDRGNFFHHALELLWGEIESHAELLALGGAGRRKLVDEVVATAAGKYIDSRVDLPAFYREIERDRAVDVLNLWLMVEIDRGPFEVLELEAERTLECGGVTVRGIVDRMDELTTGPGRGQRVIVDYKTGRSIRKEAWFDERSEEPQLPLYAIAEAEEVAALAFGGLHRDRIGYHGYSAHEDVLPKIHAYEGKDEQPEDWQGLFQFWRRTLTHIGQSFAGGDAEVFPKHPRNTCVRCDLHALCRIGDERSYREDEDELFVDEEADV